VIFNKTIKGDIKMANPINRISTFLYVHHKSLGQKDLKLDLSSANELKVVHDTWQNRLVLFVKNLFSLGTRNETLLCLAKEAWAELNGCDSLEALQNTDIKWTESAPIADEVAQRFAYMLNDRKHVQSSGEGVFINHTNGKTSKIEGTFQGTAAERFPAIFSNRKHAPGSISIAYELYQNPLVDVKIIPMENVQGMLLPAPLAKNAESLLSLAADIKGTATIGNAYGSVTIVVTK
jgi:hypothetical protein